MDMTEMKVNSLKRDVLKYKTVAHAANVFTLDIRKNKNFAIETTDGAAKTIALANVPSGTGVILSVSIKLKFTNNVAITYPAGITWQNGIIPTYATGKQYIIILTSYDAGTTWLGSVVGAW